MRAIKTTTISIFALGLLAGSAVGVAAQDEEGDVAAVDPFTVRFIPSDSVRVSQQTTEDGVTKELGNCWAPVIVEPTDQRLAGTLTFCGDSHNYGPVGLRATPAILSSTYRIENDEGAWQGSSAGAE